MVPPMPMDLAAGLGRYALAVHGGAGVLERSRLDPALEACFRAALRAALQAGEDLLRSGASSLEAVVAAVQVLEDEPLFNAGRGAVLNRDGIAELDAAVMEGTGRRAGAVAAARRIRNPVLGAREVLRRSPHVLLAGEGADAFARAAGLAMVESAYFETPARRRQWEEIRARQAQAIGAATPWQEERATERTGTVGAVAVDRAGRLAAATSTGGLAGKWPGRVGDSPLIGAGTWADDATCAVSATGHGEFFIRHGVAHEVAARIRHLGEGLVEAADQVIRRELAGAGGEGGLIAVDRHGVLALPFNNSGMYRGWVREGGEPSTAVYAD